LIGVHLRSSAVAFSQEAGMKLKVNCSVVVLCLSVIAAAASKPDFTGTWVMDKDRSFSNPPGLEQILTIVHTGDQIKLESRQKTAQGERVINETYTLDGKEAEFTPATAQPDAKGKRNANWLPDGRRIVINDTITSTSPKGPVVQQITRKWTLSTDGSTLTIDYYIDDQRGSFESNRVFVKKSSS
jgi:hypothetical protein